MAFAIQKRDIQILKYAFSFRVVTYEQIIRRYFPKSDESAAYRRIRALCAEGFLKQEFVPLGNRAIKSVAATEWAWPTISEHWSIEIDSPHFKSESPFHDIRMADIAARFERLTSFRSLMTENLLQSSSALAENPMYRDLRLLQADGALSLNGPDGRPYLYGIELEVSKKTIERYNDKLTSYYRASGIDGVIYVCSNQEIMNLVARSDRQARTGKDSIVYLGLESSVLESKEKIYFKNVESKGIGLF